LGLSFYDIGIFQLEEMEKKAGNAESEVSGLRSRLILLQVMLRVRYQDSDQGSSFYK
jgi:hypothetical protein